MAVYRRTYQVEEGSHRIWDPGIALGVIYDLTRSGTDLQETEDLTDTPPDGHFSYDRNLGYLHFPVENPFNAGEWVTIIFKAIGMPTPPPPEPPMVCEIPIVTGSLASLTVIRFSFASVGNYVLQLIPAAGSCGDTPIQSATITGGDSYLTSGLPAGSYKACVRRDCGGGMLSAQVVSNTVTVVLPPQNFGARKDPPDTEIKILSITGIPYTIRTGSLPLVNAGQEMRGRHETFTGVVSVTVQVKKKQNVVLAMYKNGPLVEFKVAYRETAGNVTVNFTSLTVLPTDDLFVVLGYN